MKSFGLQRSLKGALGFLRVMFFILFVGPGTIMSVLFVGVYAYGHTEHGKDYFVQEVNTGQKIEEPIDSKSSNCIVGVYRDSIFISALYWLLLLSPVSNRLADLEVLIRTKISSLR